jgi:hypothetical protein
VKIAIFNDPSCLRSPMHYSVYLFVLKLALAVAYASKNVCVTNFVPMDSCNVNGTADGFTGFEAEV